MHFDVADFNGAGSYFTGAGSPEWNDVEKILNKLVPRFQPSRQAGKVGSPIFDPKGTNLALRNASSKRGWVTIPVPAALRAFGNDWDGGKSGTLAEWQFSNYPFLWNNVIRTEAVFKQQLKLVGMKQVEALLVVTKSGVFPASNSSLYFEQAKAQLALVTGRGVFDVPIRLVGLGIRPGAQNIQAKWTTYAGRTSRTTAGSKPCQIVVQWTGGKSKYGASTARLTR